MSKTLLLLISLLQQILSQSVANIVVVDSISGRTLPLCSIIVTSERSQVINVTTDSQGAASLTLSSDFNFDDANIEITAPTSRFAKKRMPFDISYSFYVLFDFLDRRVYPMIAPDGGPDEAHPADDFSSVLFLVQWSQVAGNFSLYSEMDPNLGPCIVPDMSCQASNYAIINSQFNSTEPYGYSLWNVYIGKSVTRKTKFYLVAYSEDANFFAKSNLIFEVSFNETSTSEDAGNTSPFSYSLVEIPVIRDS